MKTHIQCVHEKTDEKKCDKCDFICYTDSHLVQHERSMHLNQRKKKCDSCDMTFYEPEELRRHKINIHDNGPNQSKFVPKEDQNVK